MSSVFVDSMGENKLLIVSYCEEQGWLTVGEYGATGATDAGLAWLEERDAELGYEVAWTEKPGKQAQMRILVHAAYLLASKSEAGVNDPVFRDALDQLAVSHSVSYNEGMEASG